MTLTGLLLAAPFPGVRSRGRRGMLGLWSRGVCRLLRVRIRVEGAIPPRPFLLVSNHLGYLDIPVLAAAAPSRFVAKSEVREWPGIGNLARAAGTIFVNRRSPRDALRTTEALGAAIADGESVIIFAEATSSPGERVLPFRPALLEWAARTAYPVHYASLHYRTPPGGPPAHEAVCWWGDMTFMGHLPGLARLPWIEATVRFGASPVQEGERRALAARLHRAVADQFTPVVSES
ncbi:MAG: 1-acyl-sn-glycerol-3-phosphate acyltransferase [Gemmatimonadales bacterium]|nr:MAG: 1-acyl-sn-glycerol-3-phosphate acyltransferase [Gemmatimonadales bacterium]